MEGSTMWFAGKGATRIRAPSFAKSKQASLLVPNSNYKVDLDYAFKINRITLAYTASWQYRSPFLNFLRKIGNCIHLLFSSIFLGTFTIELVRNPNIKGTDLVDAAVMLTVCTGYAVKYVVAMGNMTEIRILFEHMKDDWKYILEDSYEIMKNGAMFGHKMTKYYTIFVAFTFFSWHLNALSQSSFVVDGVRYHNLGYLADFYFFDARLYPVYPFAYIFQLYICSVNLAAMCHNCTGASFVAHATAQSEVLISFLIKLCEKPDVPDIDVKLSYIVKKHNEVIRFISRFDNIFTWIYSLEWISCISTLCMACYLTVTKPFTPPNVIKSITLFCVGTNTFLVLCLVGERYTIVMEKFGNLFGMTNWYLLTKKHVFMYSYIQLFGLRGQFITAAKYINLTMETFADVMKRTMAFFNVLKTTL